MRVLVLGGYGLIGSWVVARLHAEGHEIVGLGRDTGGASRRLSYATWIRGDLRRMLHAADWREPLEGIQAVVNCAGVLQESPRDDLAAVHVQATTALYLACGAAGVRRMVLISAASVEQGRTTRFNETKLAGEAALKATGLDWVILRPGLVLAPAAHGGTSLLRGLAALPLILPLAYPDNIVQVVSVEDVAEAVVRSIRADAPARVSLDLVSAEKTRLADLVLALRRWLGAMPAPVMRMPPALAGLTAHINDATALFGWRSPMRTTSIQQLAASVLGDAAPAQAILGFTPRTLDEMLAGWPSGVQERWFARLYFLKPALLIALIGFWAASGLIGLTAGFHAAVGDLTPRISTPLSSALVIGGANADLALAAAACFRRAAPAALKGMVGLSLLYLIGATILRPDLWADPLGPLVKTIPAALLALVALAIMDER
jgi:uncharacterized protein YbjT (DUF2867 family)